MVADFVSERGVSGISAFAWLWDGDSDAKQRLRHNGILKGHESMGVVSNILYMNL